MTGSGLAAGARITRINGLAVEMPLLGHHHHGAIRIAIAILALLVLAGIAVHIVNHAFPTYRTLPG